MTNKSCCDDNGHDCLQSDACPIYQQRRRVRAGQPAPPILLDPIDIEEDDKAPLSDAIAGLAVLVIILIIAACAALVVRALP